MGQDDKPARLRAIEMAVEAQANDPTLWACDVTAGEGYVQQSLRWLHALIEDDDREALKSILNQSNDHKQ